MKPVSNKPQGSQPQDVQYPRVRGYKYDMVYKAQNAQYSKGRDAEDLFLHSAMNAGYSVTKASGEQDQQGHIDFHISNARSTWSVDVKSKKSISRYDTVGSDDNTILEIKNVVGKEGWIYGKADYIAFAMDTEFLMVPRFLLAEWADRMIEAYPKKVFTRKGMKDQLILMPLAELIELVDSRIAFRPT